MKKILLILSAIILCIFCFASCNDKDKSLEYEAAVREDPSPENAYLLLSASADKLAKKGEKSGSINATVDVSLNSSWKYTSAEMKLTSSWNKDKFFQSADLGDLGGKTELVYADEMVYCRKDTDQGIEKYKMNMTKEEFENEATELLLPNSSSSSDAFSKLIMEDIKLTQDEFKSAWAYASEENINIRLNMLENETIKDALKEALYDATLDKELMIKRADAFVIIDRNADIRSLSISVSAGYNPMSTKDIIKINVDVEFENFGTLPEINAPDDKNEYEDRSIKENEMEIYKIYDKAVKALVKDGAYSIDSATVVKIDSKTANSKVRTDINGDRICIMVSSGTSSLKTHIRYVDGIAYVYEGATDKYKFSISLEDFIDKYGLEGENLNHFAFQGSTITDTDQGKTITLSSQKISNMAKEVFMSSIGNYEFDISEAKMTVTIDKDGNIKNESYLFKGSFNGSKISISISQDLYGDDPEIEAPLDASGYEEVEIKK